MSCSELEKAVEILARAVPNPERGLPDPIFYYASAITPMINVDLLVKDQNGRTLLAWRDDPLAGSGWHIPGGIIRFRETFEQRIRQVAEHEIGTQVEFDPKPIAVNQIINYERATRGHFISLLYRCALTASFVPRNSGLTPSSPGYLAWHDRCPDDLLVLQDIYRPFI